MFDNPDNWCGVTIGMPGVRQESGGEDLFDNFAGETVLCLKSKIPHRRVNSKYLQAN